MNKNITQFVYLIALIKQIDNVSTHYNCYFVKKTNTNIFYLKILSNIYFLDIFFNLFSIYF